MSISLRCGVRREYQNPLYDHKTEPLPTSLLSIEHPDYSPDVACRPTVLFPNIPKGKYLVCTKRGPTVDASTSNLRRNIGDSDDENKFERWHEGAEREVLTTSRKLDFGLPKKTKAVVGKGDTLWSVFPEIHYDLCSFIQLFASFLKTYSCSFVLAFIYPHVLCQSLSLQTKHCGSTYFSLTF